jgi:hypothetical protein
MRAQAFRGTAHAHLALRGKRSLLPIRCGLLYWRAATIPLYKLLQSRSELGDFSSELQRNCSTAIQIASSFITANAFMQ